MANGPGRRVEWRRVGWFIRGKDCLVHDSETQLRNSAQLLFALRFELQWFSLFKTSFPSYYFSLLQPKKLHPNDHHRFNTGTETQPTPNPATTETTHHLNPVTTDSTQPKTAEKETEKEREKSGESIRTFVSFATFFPFSQLPFFGVHSTRPSPMPDSAFLSWVDGLFYFFIFLFW